MYEILTFIIVDFLFVETLIILTLPVAVLLITTVGHQIRHDAKERELLVIRRDALILRVVQTAGAIEVEYVSEQLGIPVEEVFVCVLVVEELLLDGAEECVWILFQGCAEHFEFITTNVDHELLVRLLGDLFRGWRRKWIF